MASPSKEGEAIHLKIKMPVSIRSSPMFYFLPIQPAMTMRWTSLVPS